VQAQPGAAAAGAVPRAGRLVAQPLREGFAGRGGARGLVFAVPHFRGCSGELNHAPRAYHSGDFEEIGWILGRVCGRAAARCWRSACRWAAMRCCAGPARPATAQRARRRAVAAVSAPLDLAAGGRPSGGASTGWSTPACSCAP
jgi:predicted alpha/beta-fold hydrolase